MVARKGGVVIVELRLGAEKLEELKAKLSKMDCVDGVEFNYISSKLDVRYDGTSRCEGVIRSLIDESNQKRVGRPQGRRARDSGTHEYAPKAHAAKGRHK